MLHGNRSHTRLMLRDFTGAVDDARRAFGLDPMNIKAYWRAAKASLALQLYKQAQEFCEAGLDKAPGHADLQKMSDLCAGKLEVQQVARQKRDAEWSAEEATNLQQRHQELSGRLQIAKSTLEESKREVQRTAFIQKALADLGPGDPVYRKGGRCFMKSPRAELAAELKEHVRDIEEEKQPQLEAQATELESRAKETEEELRAMVAAFQKQKQQEIENNS
jgi:chaperonin cofactor prefoldin